MSGQWKAGDTFFARVERWPQAKTWPPDTSMVRVVVDNDGWISACQSDPASPFTISPLCAEYVHRLVVIDPEDNPFKQGTAAWIDWIEEQYLAHRPPKPEEPTGLGAVVEAANGDRWVRVEALGDPDHIHVWVCEADDEVNPRRWEDVYAVKVLSEGVTP